MSADKPCGNLRFESQLVAAGAQARWRGLPISWVEASPHEIENRESTVLRHGLAMLDQGAAQAEFGYRRRSIACDLRPGSIGVFAAGTQLRSSRWRWGATRRIMVDLDIAGLADPRLLDQLHNSPLGTELEFHDDGLAAVLRSMAHEAAQGSPNGALFAQSLSLGVAMRLLQRAASRRAAARERGRLTPEQLDRVDELIRSRLSSELSLAELAQAAGYSQAQFVRLFRNALGCSPFQHVLRLRLARARDLVLAGELPLSTVAEEAGFASQSHMTAAFTRAFRTPPGEMRRQARGGAA